jgi:L-amino acid N-acyltransferase YncA/protein-tyrosine-phosphatase
MQQNKWKPVVHQAVVVVKNIFMQIIPMLATHWPAIKKIYEDGIATGNATFQTNAPSWEDWDAGHLQHCRIVIVENETVIGWAALSPVSKRHVYAGVTEVSIYIAKEHKAKGIGNQLLQELILQSEANGIWTLQASIFPENVASIKLYQGCGFRIIGTKEKIGKMGDVWRDNVFLERRSTFVGVNDKNKKMKLLFVCVENSNRSQMSQAFAKIIGGAAVEAYSAGSKPSGIVNPKAIAAMAELGYDLSIHDSKSLQEVEQYAPFDAVVTMGCGDACPWMPAKQFVDWQIPDPKYMEPEQFNEVRDFIKGKVANLIDEINKITNA